MPTEQLAAPPLGFADTGWPENHMLEAAWGLIANSWGGNWDEAGAAWYGAAVRWRDEYATVPEPDLEPSEGGGEHPMSPTDALFGFCAWLTTREETTVMGGNMECGHVPQLLEAFMEANQLPDVSGDFPDSFAMPKTERPTDIVSVKMTRRLAESLGGVRDLSSPDEPIYNRCE
jgi:hypothetical protein